MTWGPSPSVAERDIKPDSRYLSACRACGCEGYFAPNESGQTDCFACGHPEAWHYGEPAAAPPFEYEIKLGTYPIAEVPQSDLTVCPLCGDRHGPLDE